MKKPTLIDKAFLLKQTLIFNDLDLDLLLSIADKLPCIEYDSKEVVFTYNQPADHLFIIYTGSIDIIDENNKTLKSLIPSNFFGDESLFSGRPRSYKALSTQESHILSLSKSHLLSIISECPSVAVNLLEVFARSISKRY